MNWLNRLFAEHERMVLNVIGFLILAVTWLVSAFARDTGSIAIALIATACALYIFAPYLRQLYGSDARDLGLSPIAPAPAVPPVAHTPPPLPVQTVPAATEAPRQSGLSGS